MKVTELDAWLFHYPLEHPFSPSWVPGYTTTTSSAVIYRLTTDEGLTGIAGGLAFADEARGPVNLLRAYLLGLDIDDIDEVHSRLTTASRVLGVRAWFVETAFWDLRGKAEEKSIARLLGDAHDSIRVYASTGELRTPEAAAEKAAEIVSHGYPGIKIRTRHPTLQEDLEMVAAVRGAIGEEVALFCDANQAWRVDTFAKGPVWDRDRAAAFAKGVEEYRVEWLEEPLDMYDLDGYAELRRSTEVPIAAGELHGDPGLVRLLMAAEGVDIIQPDAVFTGGISGVWGLIGEARGRGLGYAPHTWSHGLGLAANLQVALAAGNCDWLEFPYDPPGWVPEGRDAMLAAPLVPDASGILRAPQAPGLGVALDEGALEKYGTPL